MEKITKAGFARRMGISRARVTQYVQEGIISTLPDGKIDFERAKRELEGNLDHDRRLEWFARASEDPPVPFTGDLFLDCQMITFAFFFEDYIDDAISKLRSMLPQLKERDFKKFSVAFSALTADFIEQFVKNKIIKGYLEEEGIEIGSINPKRKKAPLHPVKFKLPCPSSIVPLLKELGPRLDGRGMKKSERERR